MTVRAILLAALIGACAGTDAATVSFALARDTTATSAVLLLRRIDEVEDLRKEPEIRHPVDLAKPLPSLELDPGHWSIGVEGADVWHQRQYVTVERNTTVTLEIWPRAFVTGNVVAPESQLGEMMVRFEPTSQGPPALEGDRCKIEEGVFRCGVPAVPIDLRLRAPGHVAHYFWDLRLAPGEIRDLGALKLQKGQSITGRVELPRELRGEVERVIVRAEPAGSVDGTRPLVRGGSLLTVTAEVNRKGFFHIDGVTPGAWLVRARHPRKQLYAEPVSLTVIAGADAAITGALLLGRPHRVEVAIEPARDPLDGRWTVSLLREVIPGQLEPVLERAASERGTWQSVGLLPGRYVVSVRTSTGDEWHREDVLLGTTDVTLFVAPSWRGVNGTVTIGGRPLQANLEFTNEEGGTSSTASDAEGRFSLPLPSSAKALWTVDVRSEEPPVERSVERVEINASNDVAIDLPDVTIRGEVVDEQGAPVEYPLIRVLKSGGSLNIHGSEAGTFAIAGLDPGPNELQAEGSEGTSDPLPIVIPEKGDAEPVRLVVRKQRLLRGFVVSDFGPISGARITVRPTNVPFGFLRSPTSDAKGRFSVSLPPDVIEFDIIVNAPGFSYMMDHSPYRDSLLRAEVDQAGGTLVVHGSAGNESKVQIVHGGAIMRADWIARDTNGRISDGQIVLSRMEPGPYSACVIKDENWPVFRASNGATGGKCVSGVLAPRGTLTLHVADTAAQR